MTSGLGAGVEMTDAALLASLPGLAFAFALVLCRTGMLVMLLPGLGEIEPPPMLRVGLTLALTALVLPAVLPLVSIVPPGWGAASMVASELLAGGVLGWLARLPAMALPMAGAVMSYLTGLTSVVQPDPALGGQSAALSRLFGVIVPMLVLSSGLYALPLSALVGSYQVVAPGAVMPVDFTIEMVQAAVSTSFELALRLSGPFLLLGLLFQAGLGLLARLVPQLQVYSVAAPAQILGGLALLGALAGSILSGWSEALDGGWHGLPGL